MTVVQSIAREALERLVAGSGRDVRWCDEMRALAANVGDPARVLDRLAVRRLRETVLPLADRWPPAVRDRTASIVERVIAAIEHRDTLERGRAAVAADLAAREIAARSAALAAEAAQWAAAPPTIWSRQSVWSALAAARAAWWAAELARMRGEAASDPDAAETDAWARERDRIAEELRAVAGVGLV